MQTPSDIRYEMNPPYAVDEMNGTVAKTVSENLV